MELNGYRLLLPEGTLDYFDLVDVKESVNEVVIYLEEKNIVPEKYTGDWTLWSSWQNVCCAVIRQIGRAHV